MDRKMNFFIMCFIFIIILAFTSHISYTQSLITGSTTWGTEIVTISPDTYTPKISELLRGTGLDEITCKFITLDGKNNEIKIDIPFLSSEFDLDTGGGELKAGFEVVNLFISSSRGEENNWVGVEGKLGGHAIRFELSFKPGFKAITSSTAQDPNNLAHTTFRIRLFNKDDNNYRTLFEKSTSEWEKISVDNYIKDNIFPEKFEVYLNSLGELDNYEIEFITLLEKLPKDKQVYYAKEVYDAGFNQKLLQQLQGEAKKNETLLKIESEKEVNEITSMINNLFEAIENQDWEQIKRYCLPGSQAYLEADEAKDNAILAPGTKMTVKLVINKIEVSDITATVYCSVTAIMTLEGKIINEDNSDGIIFLKKVDNEWKMTKAQ
jgi:hypothetical protein